MGAPAPLKVPESIDTTETRDPANVRSRFLGCLLGGAVGDALGAPVEFMSLREIRRRFGKEGVTSYAPAYGRKAGAITDDTQMTLFTAEGLIRAEVRGKSRGLTTFEGVIAHAYQRWLRTQGERSLCATHPGEDCDGWLMGHPELHHQRAPGNTCLAALRQMRTFGDMAANTSKGCGGVMRVAPVGLFAWHWRAEERLERAFDLGAAAAALTHGHPTGSLPAGVLAATIACLVEGLPLPEALRAALGCLCRRPEHVETAAALHNAIELAASETPRDQAIARLGQGWVAEEALAIAVYSALVAEDFREGLVVAVNHDGDSDSTGSIAGNLLGAMLSVEQLPRDWLEELEARQIIEELATDLFECAGWDLGEDAKDPDLSERICKKYPGW